MRDGTLRCWIHILLCYKCVFCLAALLSSAAHSIIHNNNNNNNAVYDDKTSNTQKKHICTLTYILYFDFGFCCLSINAVEQNAYYTCNGTIRILLMKNLTISAPSKNSALEKQNYWLILYKTFVYSLIYSALHGTVKILFVVTFCITTGRGQECVFLLFCYFIILGSLYIQVFGCWGKASSRNIPCSVNMLCYHFAQTGLMNCNMKIFFRASVK